jgi:hypothetical protein
LNIIQKWDEIKVHIDEVISKEELRSIFGKFSEQNREIREAGRALDFLY